MSKQSHTLNILRGGNQSPLKVADLLQSTTQKRKEEILRFLLVRMRKPYLSHNNRLKLLYALLNRKIKYVKLRSFVQKLNTLQNCRY